MHMDTRLSLILIVSACLLGTALTYAAGAPPQPWYGYAWNVEGTARDCHAAEPLDTPLAHIRLVEVQGWPHKVVDVEAQGEVVETTLIRYRSRWGDYSEMTWYRGRARCKAALRELERREQGHAQELQRKYR